MNIANRISKLENEMTNASNPEGLCRCINGIITEFRKWNAEEVYKEADAPVFCETCRRTRQKIIVEFVDATTSGKTNQ